MNSAAVPMATPPARVAFWICTCQVKQDVSHEKLKNTYMLKCSFVNAAELARLKWAWMCFCCFLMFSVTKNYHVQFSSLLRYAGDGHSGENGRSKGDISVDGCSVLSITVICDGRVETGPEHPQKQCTCKVRETNQTTVGGMNTCKHF